jgi:hypothetical protein
LGHGGVFAAWSTRTETASTTASAAAIEFRPACALLRVSGGRGWRSHFNARVDRPVAAGFRFKQCLSLGLRVLYFGLFAIVLRLFFRSRLGSESF